MKFKDIENKSKTELNELLNDLKAESFTLGWKNKTQQLDQTHKIKLVRRDIAKVLTALKQVELKESLEKQQKQENIKSSKKSTKKSTPKKEGNK